MGVQQTKKLSELVSLQSCVKEALLLAGLDGVHALHDATEGGVTSALNELAEASKVGFRVDWNSFLFPESVQILKDTYRLSDSQLLSMSSTGTFLVAVAPDAKTNVESVLLQNGVDARFVGVFTKDLGRVLVKNKKETVFPSQADDPYARILSTQSAVSCVLEMSPFLSGFC